MEKVGCCILQVGLCEKWAKVSVCEREKEKVCGLDRLLGWNWFPGGGCGEDGGGGDAMLRMKRRPTLLPSLDTASEQKAERQ